MQSTSVRFKTELYMCRCRSVLRSRIEVLTALSLKNIKHSLLISFFLPRSCLLCYSLVYRMRTELPTALSPGRLGLMVSRTCT